MVVNIFLIYVFHEMLLIQVGVQHGEADWDGGGWVEGGSVGREELSEWCGFVNSIMDEVGM